MGCGCPMEGVMSKKKKIKVLKEQKKAFEEKIDDIKEFIKELES